jgi:hypothetical protein
MKQEATVLISLSVILLFGCPAGLKYSPGKPGTEKLDTRILGKWVTSDEFSVFKKAEVTQVDEFTFRAKLEETTDMYILGDETELNGWTTVIDNQSFLYIFSKQQEEFYSYGFTFKDGGLVMYDAALLEGGQDAVVSTETFRSQLAASIKKEEWYSDPVIYKKVSQ